MCVGYMYELYGDGSRIGRTYKHYTHSNLRINNKEYLHVCVYWNSKWIIKLSERVRTLSDKKSARGLYFVLRYFLVDSGRLYTFWKWRYWWRYSYIMMTLFSYDDVILIWWRYSYTMTLYLSEWRYICQGTTRAGTLIM